MSGIGIYDGKKGINKTILSLVAPEVLSSAILPCFYRQLYWAFVPYLPCLKVHIPQTGFNNASIAPGYSAATSYQLDLAIIFSQALAGLVWL